VTGASRHITRLTAFTHDVFACFVCSIYVHDGLSDIAQHFEHTSMSEFGSSLFSALLGGLTFVIAVKLTASPEWRVLPKMVRNFLGDYAVTIAVVTATIISYSVPIATEHVPRIELPTKLGPTLELDGKPRAWVTAIPGGGAWLAGILSAVPISFFFYMDQNISSLLCQLPEMQLERGEYLHSSMLVMGALNVLGPIFGLPFVTGSLPHSPQFVRALRLRSGGVAEGRVAPLITYILIGAPLLAPALVEHLPTGAIDGVLIFVGFEGIVSTNLWKRLVLLITPKSLFPQELSKVSTAKVHLFTALQVALFLLCWAVNISPLGLMVAFVIAALVPMREMLLPRIFSRHELLLLDPSAGISEDNHRSSIPLENRPMARMSMDSDNSQSLVK
jgi:hypothetical protein